MKKILVIIAAFLASSSAFAGSRVIEGNWGMKQAQGGYTFDVTFSISQNTLVITNVCTGLGTTATARVQVAASYTDSQLTIHEFREDHQSREGLNCDISSKPDTMDYSVQGNVLIFTQAGTPGSLVLNRK